MSLASRLSAFFLVMLGAVLVGFATTLYALASHYLHLQIDERLDAALATLAAAAEVGPAGVEWEPGERELGLGRDSGADQIRWVIRDDRGRVVDRSANLNPRRLPPETLPDPSDPEVRGRDGRYWRSKTRRVIAADLDKEPDLDPSSPGYAAITLVAFAPLGPTESALRQLALTLAVLSVVLWLLAAVTGRRLCRRALAPLSRMSLAARDAEATDPSARLPLPGTRDELEDLGQAFNGLLDRLHDALERQRQFTGGASHQLRTPLAGVLSQVDVALKRDRSPEEYRRVLGVVRSKAAQLRQILDSLLFLARAESESERPHLERMDLSAWVSQHLQSCWSAHPRAEDLQVVPAGEGPLWVCAHPPLMAQLVDNLVENACKYSQPGTPIQILLERRPGGTALVVQDHGCGLTAEEQARVFEPFYRTPAARSQGPAGVGLGLALAQRIANAFGGTLRVQSQPGEGSRFDLELPEPSAQDGDADGGADADGPHRAARTAAGTGTGSERR
jgi:signal transduction histidine kinase